MKVSHSGTTYECAVAVKCTDDKYIKLYDASGAEIAAFHNISDFSQYTISGGSFIAPCDCVNPIRAINYAMGGRTIKTSDWTLTDGEYLYEIENALISSNTTTCNVMLIFAEGTELNYKSTQAAGKITLNAGSSAPLVDVVIKSIQISRV